MINTHKAVRRLIYGEHKLHWHKLHKIRFWLQNNTFFLYTKNTLKKSISRRWTFRKTFKFLLWSSVANVPIYKRKLFCRIQLPWYPHSHVAQGLSKGLMSSQKNKNEKYSNIHKMWLKVLKLSHDVVREPPQDLLRYYKVRFLIEYVILNYIQVTRNEFLNIK